MILAQVAAMLAVGMPFPGKHLGPFIAAAKPIEVSGIKTLVDEAARGRVWLVNDKGYVTHSWPEKVPPEEIVAWQQGASLPVGSTAVDPRLTVVPLPRLSAAYSWLDMFAAGIKLAKAERMGPKGGRGLLVLFLSTYGPADHLYIERINQIAETAAAADITTLGLFSGKSESRAALARFTVGLTIKFPCAIDPGNAFADAYRATRTPEAFLMDSQMRVVYAGAIDSSTFGGEGTIQYLQNAMRDFSAGEKVKVAVTRVFGTPIDR